jgi:hypothetical protein
VKCTGSTEDSVKCTWSTEDSVKCTVVYKGYQDTGINYQCLLCSEWATGHTDRATRTIYTRRKVHIYFFFPDEQKYDSYDLATAGY